MSYISPQALLEPGVYIGHNVTIYGATRIKRGTIIEDNCVVGKPSRTQMERFQALLKTAERPLTQADYDAVIDTPTIIGEGVTLHSGSIIYSGCTLGDGVILEDNCLIRWDTRIGAHTKLMIGLFCGSYITVGEHCRVGGLLGNRSVIGNYVTSFGHYLHEYKQYGANHVEAAPHVEDRVMIGYNSLLVGGIRVGEGSYVAAGSVLTHDVPASTVVRGRNEQTPMREWQGSLTEQYEASFPDEAHHKDR